MPNDTLKRRAELKKAVDEHCNGNVSTFAKKIGETQQKLWFWLNESKKGVPGDVAIKIERKYGVPRGVLRPDLYPVEGRRA